MLQSQKIAKGEEVILSLFYIDTLEKNDCIIYNNLAIMRRGGKLWHKN